MGLYCAAKDISDLVRSSWVVVNRELDIFPKEGEYDYDEQNNNEKLYVGPGSDWELIAYEGLVQWE